jgi:adenylate cyclase
VLIRRLGLLRVKGKTQAMAVYEALAELPGTLEQVDRKERYEQAFDLYLARQWNDAEAILTRLISDHPEDHPAGKLLAVVREFRAAPPPDDWDGVYTAHEK